jgi:CPA1 family monovalent cation:H+ antiporter
LKVLAKGENLFNDATALIILVFIGLYSLAGVVLSVPYVIEISIVVIAGSLVAGVLAGYIGLVFMKTTTNRIAEMMVLVITGYGAFELAGNLNELLHLFGINSSLYLSGILSCIFATITVHHVITQSISEENELINRDEAELTLNTNKALTFTGAIQKMLSRIKATVNERAPSAHPRG